MAEARAESFARIQASVNKLAPDQVAVFHCHGWFVRRRELLRSPSR